MSGAKYLAEMIERVVDEKIAKALRGGTKTVYGEYVGTDSEGKSWVMLPGADNATPVKTMSVEAKAGDIVSVTIGNGRATVSANVSNPGAGVAGVKSATEKADTAQETADSASNLASQASNAAAIAQTSAENALVSANDAAEYAADAANTANAARASADSASVAAGNAITSADSAKAAADSANESATQAVGYATQAREAASEAIETAEAAKDSADTAKAAADQAVEDAASAKQSATEANTAANGAVTGLATVQQVVDQLEADVDDLQVHVAMMDAYPDGHGGTVPAGLHIVPTGAGYFLVSSNDGVYVYDSQNNFVTKFGESIDFASTRPQKIGNDSTYVRFYDSDNDGIADRIEVVADSVSIGTTDVSTALSQKADNSTVTAVANRVTKNEQDISGINTTIGSLQTTVESKADGSALTTVSNKLNTVSDTVDGHTQTISSVQSTLANKADSSTVSTLTTRVSDVEQDVSGFKQTVSETYATKNEAKQTDSASGLREIVTEDAAELPLLGLTVHGECAQDGTPTPDAPVEVKVVRGRNLFDASTAVHNSTVSTAGSIFYDTNYCRSDYIPVKPGKQYYVQGLPVVIGFKADKTFNRVIRNSNTDGAFTATNDDAYVIIRNYAALSTVQAQDEAIGVTQLELGSTPTPYVPYGHVAAVTNSKNLLEAKQSYAGSASGVYYIDFLAQQSAHQIGRVELVAGETYTLSFDIESSVSGFNISVGCGNGFYEVDIESKNNLSNGRVSLTFTPTEAKLSNGNLLAFRAPRFSTKKDVTFKVSNIQLEAGSTATDYEPYRESVSYIDLKGNGAYYLDDEYQDTVELDASGHVLLNKRCGRKTIAERNGSGRYAAGVYWVRFNDMLHQDVTSGTAHDNTHPLLSTNFVHTTGNATVWTGSSLVGYFTRHTVAAYPSYNHEVFFRIADDLTNADFCEQYADVEVVYPLDEPYDIDLGYIDPPITFDGGSVRVIAEIQPVIDASWWTKVGYDAGKAFNEGSNQADLSALTERVSTAESSITQQAGQIALKANSSDVYTKTQADGKVSTAVNAAKAEIKLTTDAISSDVGKVVDGLSQSSHFVQTADGFSFTVDDAIDDAAKTATSYVSDVTGGGVMVHPKDDDDSGWKISSAIELLKDNVSHIWSGLSDGVALMRIGLQNFGNIVLSGLGYVQIRSGSNVVSHMGVLPGDAADVQLSEDAEVGTAYTLPADMATLTSVDLAGTELSASDYSVASGKLTLANTSAVQAVYASLTTTTTETIEVEEEVVDPETGEVTIETHTETITTTETAPAPLSASYVRSEGVGAAFGKQADRPELDVAMPARFEHPSLVLATHTNANADTGFRAYHSGTGVRLQISAVGNHGVWSEKLKRWLIYANESQTHLAPFVVDGSGTSANAWVVKSGNYASTGSAPSSTVYGGFIGVQDNAGYTVGYMESFRTSSDVIYTKMVSRRKIGSSEKTNTVALGVDKTGAAKVAVSGSGAQKAWRDAIGAITNLLDNRSLYIDMSTMTDNKKPSSTVTSSGFVVRDSKDVWLSRVAARFMADGKQMTVIDCHRAIGGTDYYNSLLLGVDSSGDNFVNVSSSAAWRTGINAVNKSGDTISGTLVLSKRADASGTANNSPALIVGGTASQSHIEIDDNEIQAKANATSTAGLSLNYDGGDVSVNGVNVRSAAIINSGTFDDDRIPSLPASKIGSGTLAIARLKAQSALWTGAIYMGDTQTANLSANVSAQMNGIVLVFSFYDTKAEDWNWNEFFVPKKLIADHGGLMHTFIMGGSNFTNMAVKYLRIYDNKITGHESNTKTGTTSGIAYVNNKYVLRAVYGV